MVKTKRKSPVDRKNPSVKTKLSEKAFNRIFEKIFAARSKDRYQLVWTGTPAGLKKLKLALKVSK